MTAQDQEIQYSELIDGAMRAVVREVLRQVSQSGLPGDHHFYITFRTDLPGVQMSPTLRARYPREMTIVLQHQFWDFRVEDHQFHVTLSFGGVPEKLTVPYTSLVAFADPGVKFGLQFQPLQEDDMPVHPLYDDEPEDASGPGDAPESTGEKVISLDAFRKK